MKPILTFVMIVLILACGKTQRDTGMVETVHGPVEPNSLGMTLSHEHLFSNFSLPLEETDTYDEAALFSQVIPYLRSLHEQGIRTIIDYTANYFGRRPDLLKAIADSTGIQIVTNTGIYGAANDRYVPQYAYEYSAEKIARRWIAEAEQGINGTSIRPGFIKLAFDEGPPTDIDRKLFEAGIKTHLETGLTVAVHTGNNPEAVGLQLSLLDEYGVDPSAWIWTHGNWHNDLDRLLEVAAQGAWISLDGVKRDNVEQYLDYIQRFREADLLDRLLLSHDGDAYPAGGEIRPFEAIPTALIPAMRVHGFPEAVIDQLLVENPGKAYAVKVRRDRGL